ncbi:hypothetical protein RJ55_00946 [Drechmeria coniospora]|nr:hypothetical protein RJ55_00946 [Drechmeria coniospora]
MTPHPCCAPSLCCAPSPVVPLCSVHPRAGHRDARAGAQSGDEDSMASKVLRAIVRNDAMRADPDDIYGWRIFALAGASCFGGMLFGWDTGAIGGILALPAFQQTFGTGGNADLEQNIVSTLQAGCFAACFVTSWLTERYGRRRCLVATGAIAVVGVVLQTASAANGTLAIMYVGRFVAGLGVGAASTLTPLYVSECAPRSIRGGLTGT